MKKSQTFVCSECGFESLKWMGKCQGCGAWNTMEEVETLSSAFSKSSKKSSSLIKTSKIEDIQQLDRLTSGIEEFDRVLGGGAVSGEVVVLGGQPGVGKSTLLLSVAFGFAEKGLHVLYFSAEESLEQVFGRAKRILNSKLDLIKENLEFVNSIDADDACSLVSSKKYDVIIIDSVQAISTSDISSVAGSVSQVRESAYRITHAAKDSGTFVILVGHVTKEGSLAGPMVLSHVVDAVFVLESENLGDLRILRSIKNRFGSIDEAGIFQMNEDGMRPISNVSNILIDENIYGKASGIARGVLLEGIRPILIDVQALVTKSGYSMPKRISNGMSMNRLQMLIAVLTKHVKANLNDYDVFINIAGGFRTSDPAMDLPVCIAILSSLKNKPVNSENIFIGEVGLAGEIRTVSKHQLRVKECNRLGFKNVYPQFPSKKHLSLEMISREISLVS
jgi:DNA repair protein RadA/Sms